MAVSIIGFVGSLFLFFISVDATSRATTFPNVIYKRGVAHRKGIPIATCLGLCRKRPDCWGVNYIEGVKSLRGECQLLYKSIATCDPTGHRTMPTDLNARAIWVRNTCPLQRKMFGQNTVFRRKDSKSFLGDDPCSGQIVRWRATDNSQVQGGTYMRGPTNFLECLDSCAVYTSCQAIDFNFVGRTCFHIDTTDTDKPSYKLENASCCAHAKIQCDNVYSTSTPTYRPTTTTRAPPITTTSGHSSRPGPTGGATQSRYTRPFTRTTESITLSPGFTTKPVVTIDHRIPDSGCPGPFMKFPQSGRQGGMPVLSLPYNSSEACKQYCLDMGDACTAVDFDNDVSVCYTFSTPDPQNLERGTRPCCDHFARLHCEELTARTCYQHGPLLFLANPNEHNIIVSAMPPLAPPDLAIVPCEGVCFQNLDHVTEFGYFSLTRGCNTSLGTGRSWRSCVSSADPFIHDKNCSCAFDRCNGVNTFLFDSLTSHYAFDRNVEDLSGFNRNGRPHNLMFDPVTAIRGYSAEFDGVSSYAHFPSWQLVHAENIGPDGSPLLSFTVALWLLRPQTATGSMTVLSTYRRDLSTIQILSETETSNPWNPVHNIKASIVVNHTLYEIQAPAPLDDWFFVAFTLDGLRNPPLLALDIDDLENIVPEASLELTNVTALDELAISNRGLFLGKQAQVILGIDQPYFFKGHIDDVFSYDKALSYHELLALRDLRLPLP